ncbi:hypothetical protein E6H19_00540 [Candidatus Bathyarchaeota archaeon]|nr:MAG: hypothetical protein E6H30_05865 [Candidatus Bathyarchaeota archaeon]TMI46798.1 MAG: hypothetical protein E6H19_00540 [Candidatus Bathyarchaeota archaeon]
MRRENSFLISLAILLVTSVVLLSTLRVQNLATYLNLFTLCYFADSFVFRPKRRSIDFVGLGLLYYSALFLAIAFRVL